MFDFYANLMGGILLSALAIVFAVGAVIAVVMGFCFLREYVHEANERWMQIREDEDDE